MEHGTLSDALKGHKFVFRKPYRQEEVSTEEGVCRHCDARIVVQRNLERNQINWAYITWRTGAVSKWTLTADYPTPEEAQNWKPEKTPCQTP